MTDRSQELREIVRRAEDDLEEAAARWGSVARRLAGILAMREQEPERASSESVSAVIAETLDDLADTVRLEMLQALGGVREAADRAERAGRKLR